MSALAMFKRVFNSKQAWLVNTVTGAVLFILGDAIEQKMEGGKPFNFMRSVRMGTIGLVQGPPRHLFYTLLDKKLPGNTSKVVGKKVLLDQLVSCPAFTFQFFIGMGLLEGKTYHECWKEFKEKFPTVYIVDCLLWPPTAYINFYLIPPVFRVLYVNSMTVLWNVFLSYMKHKDAH